MMTMSGQPQHLDFNHPDFLHSIKRREQSHWAQLYERMQAELYAFFCKKLPSCDAREIDDCIIEVFSRAYVDIQTFQGTSGLKSWLMHFASYVARDTLRAVPQ